MNKPRGRWGRRFGWGLAGFAVLVIASSLLWVLLSGRGVSARVARLKAAGEPVLPADFATPPDGPDNGGTEVLRIGEAMYAYQKANESPDWGPMLPLTPAERQGIEKRLSDLAPQMAAFRAARAKPRHDWDLDLTSPVLVKMLPTLNGVRAVARLHEEAALLAHEKGDDAAALRHIDDIRFIAHFADKHPSLVGHLVSIGCHALATETIFDIAPDLKIGTAQGDAPPQDVRRMIDALLDERAYRDGLRQALRGERMMQLDSVRALRNGVAVPTGPGVQARPYNPVMRVGLSPLLNRNAALMLDRMTEIIPLADEPDYPSARAKLPAPPDRGNPLNMMANILLPSLDRMFNTHHRLSSDRRMAAAALAIRWYQLDHAGRRPPTLDALVPKYLPAVPKDALLANQPIGYLPNAKRPRLYSAGENNKDDRGDDALMRPYPDGRAAARGEEWRQLDRPVYLDRQPRPKPEPETPAIDLGPDVTGEPVPPPAADEALPSTLPAEPSPAP